MYGQDFLIIFFISLSNIFMKNKALNNLEAAQLLINNRCYTESVAILDDDKEGFLRSENEVYA